MSRSLKGLGHDPSAVAGSINGLITPGTGITLTGGGTALSPYAINSVWTKSGNDIYNNNTGNVGIGTSSPNNKLHIEGGGDNLVMQLKNTGTGGHDWWLTSQANSGGFGQGALAIYDNTVGTARLLINASGNVGIGTASPAAAKLTIGAVANWTGLLDAAVKQAGSYGFAIQRSADDSILQMGYDSANSRFEISTNYNSSGANLPLSITPRGNQNLLLQASGTGNVGIGTITPTQKLDVNGNAKATNVITPSINIATASDFSIGQGATASSLDGTAVAIGAGAQATAVAAVAIGPNDSGGGAAIADAEGATAIGNGSFADALFATAIGNGAGAYGQSSVSMGLGSAFGDQSICISGGLAQAGGFASTAIGYNSTANSDYSLVMGTNVVAFGANSVAIGAVSGASGNQQFIRGANSFGIVMAVQASRTLNVANSMMVLGGCFIFDPSTSGGGAISAKRADFDLGRSKDCMILPIGTTAQRPGTGVNGMDRFNTDVGDFEVYNGAWQPRGRPGILTPAAGVSINAKTVANTLVYTVPAGKTCVVTGYVVRCTAASAITVGPSASVGTTAGGTDIAASQTMAVLTGTTNIFNWPIVGMSVSSTASVYFNIGTASTGTSQTIAVDLIGYLV